MRSIELLIIFAVVAILAAVSGGIAGRQMAQTEFADIIDGHLLVEGDTVTDRLVVGGEELNASQIAQLKGLLGGNLSTTGTLTVQGQVLTGGMVAQLRNVLEGRISGDMAITGDLTVQGKTDTGILAVQNDAKIFGNNLEVGASGAHIEPNITLRYGTGPSSYGYFALYATNPTGPAYEIDKEVIIENDVKSAGMVYSTGWMFGEHLGDEFWRVTIDPATGDFIKQKIEKTSTAVGESWDQYQ